MANIGTICAIASALGQGGIGVVRISGELAADIAKKMLGQIPKPRYAHYGSFFDENGSEIDKGIAIFYPNPHSFTGEDVLELQGHGGVCVSHSLLQSVINLGATAAAPGEFSKRAFLNGKMDLVQAEAVADIICAGSDQAARCALRSLSGEFSAKIKSLTKALIELRVFVEATIDFIDEPIDFLEQDDVAIKIDNIKAKIQTILDSAQQGAVLREGLSVAIIGKPNAGKSSLLNALTHNSSAIVTDIAGTTRDTLKETIYINGMPLNIIDTAGLCVSSDKIEQEGIKRTFTEVEKADVILLVFDGRQAVDLSILPKVAVNQTLLLIKNKIDLTGEKAALLNNNDKLEIRICAKQADGIDLLTTELIKIAGLSYTGESVLLARKRHIIALETALLNIQNAQTQLQNNSTELLAEELRQAAQALASITGEFSSDDLLGEIFSSFCIGK